jgi:hypothetical protein
MIDFSAAASGRKRPLRFQILTELNVCSYPKAVIQKRAVKKTVPNVRFLPESGHWVTIAVNGRY